MTATPPSAPTECCQHGIHFDNACGACVPPRGTTIRPAPTAAEQAQPENAVDTINAILYQADRGNVSLPWLLDALRGIVDRATPVPEQPAGGWIDVNDRKPKKNTEVLIAFRDMPLPATGQYTQSRHDNDGWCYPSENDPEESGPVTHWQPLPEHPVIAIDAARAQEGEKP